MKTCVGILVLALVGLAAPKAYGQTMTEDSDGSSGLTAYGLANPFVTAIENGSPVPLVTYQTTGRATITTTDQSVEASMIEKGQFTVTVSLVPVSGDYMLQVAVTDINPTCTFDGDTSACTRVIASVPSAFQAGNSCMVQQAATR